MEVYDVMGPHVFEYTESELLLNEIRMCLYLTNF